MYESNLEVSFFLYYGTLKKSLSTAKLTISYKAHRTSIRAEVLFPIDGS